MLRKHLLNCKLNIKDFSHYVPSSLEDFDPEFERCPSCNALGLCRKHGSYERWLTDIDHGEPIDLRIKIPRVICSCGHTHGVNTDGIVPYRWYSLPFILFVLGLYLSGSMTIEKLCKDYGISHSTLYRWLSVYLDHKLWWLGALQSDRTTALTFLNILLNYPVFSDFTRKFFQKTLFSFLQSHANPANCDRMPPGWLPLQSAPT